MPILPLPQFEADLAEQDRALYESLKPPTSVVVKFGIMKLIGEFAYSGDSKPGCGSKLVCRTHRGTELCEMLTSTCPNAGCSKSITRQEMLEYIDRSGGKDYPFFNQGRVLRVATIEDLNAQARLEESRPKLLQQAREAGMYVRFPAKIVDAEPILGGERVTFYFTSEDRVDFRALVDELAKTLHVRIEMRQVGARDEARLVADYEKCGQHCCCKQFLKVLKPVSMKNAKIQKATLDPLKISGRCGRLMCCLRYEESTYDDLRARLPKRKTRVETEHGVGFVLDTQILTQLVLVQLEDKDERVAVALEELRVLAPGEMPSKPRPQPPAAAPGAPTSRDRQGAAPPVNPQGRDPQSRDQRPPQQRDQRPQQQPPRGPRPDGPRQDGPRQDGPPLQRDERQGGQPPRDQQGRPPEQHLPQQQRPAPQDELDEIMDALDAGDTGQRDFGPEDRSGPPGQGDGQSGGRRRRRRRRRGGGGGSGPGGGPPQGGQPPSA